MAFLALIWVVPGEIFGVVMAASVNSPPKATGFFVAWSIVNTGTPIWMVWTMARPGMVVGAEGVTVTTFMGRVRRFPWSEISSFAVRPLDFLQRLDRRGVRQMMVVIDTGAMVPIPSVTGTLLDVTEESVRARANKLNLAFGLGTMGQDI